MDDRDRAEEDGRDLGRLGAEDVSSLAELLDEGVARWDAGTVLSGEELWWFELMERVRSAGPDPVFVALGDEELVVDPPPLGDREGLWRDLKTCKVPPYLARILRAREKPRIARSVMDVRGDRTRHRIHHEVGNA